MSDAPNYPYATHLNILYPPLEVVDVPALVAQAFRNVEYQFLFGIAFRTDGPCVVPAVPCVNNDAAKLQAENSSV